MAGEDKTEAPTPKRLEQARKRGQLPMSKEIPIAVGLLVLFAVLAAGSNTMMSGLKDLMRQGLLDAGKRTDLSVSSLMAIIADYMLAGVKIVAIPVLAVAASGIALGLMQTRFNIASEALKPNFSALNPINGLKRVFGTRGIFETGKELIKMAVIFAVAYMVLWPRRPEMANLVGMAPADILPYVASLALKLGMWVSGAYLLLAAADFLFQRWQTMRDLRMTKEEVKQEAKQADMPAEIKGAIKRRQREAAQRRMMADVPNADVVITNPTHYAVALKYEAGTPAPKVLAKGQDHIALKIRELATEHDVEIVENPPLARSLHSSAEVGDWIPEELFTAVAQVLAYVFRRRDERKGRI